MDPRGWRLSPCGVSANPSGPLEGKSMPLLDRQRLTFRGSHLQVITAYQKGCISRFAIHYRRTTQPLR